MGFWSKFCWVILFYFVCGLPFGFGGVVNELVAVVAAAATRTVAAAEFELLLLWLFSSPSSLPTMGDAIVYGCAQFGRFVIIMWLDLTAIHSLRDASNHVKPNWMKYKSNPKSLR